MAKQKQSVPKDAQRAYKYTGPALEKPKRGAAKGLSGDFLAQVIALYQAGVLDPLLALVGIKRPKSARRGVDLSQIMVLMSKYGPVIEMLVALFGKYLKPDTKPVEVAEEPTRPSEEPDLTDGEPSTPALREAVDFGQNVHWITRKKAMSENSGRKLVGDAEKAEIWNRSTPAMQGDRVCVDCTPRDAQGRPFLPGQAENETITWKHEGLGIGELQLQEEVDFTPVFLVPWKGLDMDTKHEAGIRSLMFVNGKHVKTREHSIRVHTRGLD